MDLLEKFSARTAELLRALPPQARFALALIVVVLAAVGGVAYYGPGGSGSETHLMGGETFSPTQLREMQAAFGRAGLEAKVESGRIRVPHGQESKYMAALAEAHALPVEFGDYLTKALGTGSLVPMSRSQQEAALRLARQQELQLIIGHMRGIEKAAVQIDQTKSEGFPREQSIITAAVMVQPKAGTALDESTALAIRDIVSSSVAGLKREAITVVDLVSHRSLPATGAGGASSELADHKRRREADWQQKLSAVLAYIPGVLVSTSVELGADSPAGAGQPAAAQLPTVKHVQVSVAVPQSYFEQIWRRENPATPGRPARRPDTTGLTDVAQRERKKIESLVANLLPPEPQTAGGQSRVAISTFHEINTAPPPEADHLDVALAWLARNWSLVALSGLAVLGLMAMRNVGAPSPKPIAPVDPNDDTLPTEVLTLVGSSEEPDEPLAAGRSALELPALAPVDDELAGIVRDDPDGAASILRTWIGNAS